MATQCSFDITSNVDLQEVDNALNQARKEVAQRYDFKGSKASIEFDAKESKLVLVADDDFKLNSLWEIVQTRLVRRNVPVKNLSRGAALPAANSTVRQEIKLAQAEVTGTAKSSVHALFGSKEELQLATIDAARESFVTEVVAPALTPTEPGRSPGATVRCRRPATRSRPVKICATKSAPGRRRCSAIRRSTTPPTASARRAAS